jgi:threonine dehydratase
MCVPIGTSPEKLDSVRSLGAEVIETGSYYDETLAEALRICEERGLTFIHATHNPNIVAGAGTMTLEIIEQLPEVDAIVIANGGGSQCVGALAVLGERAPRARVFAVGAAGAPAQFESWRQGKVLTGFPVNTMAEGIATGAAFEFTFEALRGGLSDFVSVTEEEIVTAIRDLYRITHNVAEGAGGAGLAGLRHLAPQLAGKKVVIMMCGGNLDSAAVRKVFA